MGSAVGLVAEVVGGLVIGVVVGLVTGALGGLVAGVVVGSALGDVVGLGALGGGSHSVSGSCPSSARPVRSMNCAIACVSSLVQCGWPGPSVVNAAISGSIVCSSCLLRASRGLALSCRWVVIVHERTRVLTWTMRPSTSVSIATVVK